MGLFNKLINVFYDEEPEEEIKKEEVKKEEKTATKPVSEYTRPRVEEVHIPREEPERPLRSETLSHREDISERELFRTEAREFKFPVVDEVKETPKVRRSGISFEEEKPIRREVRPERREMPKTEVKENPVRTFKPSPIISPVFGIQDKNYSKEEIKERQEPIIRHDENNMNYDSVRRKAYGTLEDELENTLSNIIKDENVEKTLEEANNFDKEENNKSIEDLLNEIEINKNMSIGEIEERIKDLHEEKIKLDESLNYQDEEYTTKASTHSFLNDSEKVLQDEEDGDNNSFDKTLEHDLFNLIDSMYEERDEK